MTKYPLPKANKRGVRYADHTYAELQQHWRALQKVNAANAKRKKKLEQAILKRLEEAVKDCECCSAKLAVIREEETTKSIAESTQDASD